MGIKGLAKFISDYAPKAVKEQEFASFVGRVLAIDASMSLYQFMIAIRDTEFYGNLTNQAGDTTSHLTGFLARAVRLLENGIKPVYVFDGKPPTMKGGELAKRKDKREQAEKSLSEAREVGDIDEIRKQVGRTVKVTSQHNQEVKRLLGLIGIPVVDAPCEAEAQCAELTKTGKVFGTATEDADALTFGSKVLVRHLNYSDAKTKQNPILSITLEVLLEELGLSMSQFVDFCILCGCDYCDTIKGIGAKTAYNLIKQHLDIETVITNIDLDKHPLPENFAYKDARALFIKPEVTAGQDIKIQWKDPDTEGLIKFLVEENNFNATRVENYINRLKKARGKSCQMRLESFFGPSKIVSSTVPVAKKEDLKKLQNQKNTGKLSSTVKKTPNTTSAAGKRKAPMRHTQRSLLTKGDKFETKQESKEETKQESKEETKEETTEESKEETKEESKEETKEESKEETREESKEETKKETKEVTEVETKGESKEEIKAEAKEETEVEIDEEEGDEPEAKRLMTNCSRLVKDA